MLNEEKKVVDLFIPRKCSVTKRVVAHNDHASVQFTIPKVNQQGVLDKDNAGDTFVLSGRLRMQGQADKEMNKIFIQRQMLKA